MIKLFSFLVQKCKWESRRADNRKGWFYRNLWVNKKYLDKMKEKRKNTVNEKTSKKTELEYFVSINDE